MIFCDTYKPSPPKPPHSPDRDKNGDSKSFGILPIHLVVEEILIVKNTTIIVATGYSLDFGNYNSIFSTSLYPLGGTKDGSSIEIFGAISTQMVVEK